MYGTENLRFAAGLLMVHCLPFSPDGSLLDVTCLVCTEPETNILKVMLYPKYLSQKALKICKRYSCWLGGHLVRKKEKEDRFSSSINRSCCSISACIKAFSAGESEFTAVIRIHSIFGTLTTWMHSSKAQGPLQRVPLKAGEKAAVWRRSCTSP